MPVLSGARVLMLWRIIHHCVAHPLLLFGCVRFHDWTAAKAFPQEPDTDE